MNVPAPVFVSVAPAPARTAVIEPVFVARNVVPVTVPCWIRPPEIVSVPVVWVVLPRSSVPLLTVRFEPAAPSVPPVTTSSVPPPTEVPPL